MCTCVPWFMPHNSTYAMCDPWMEKTFMTEFDNFNENDCNDCLPDCEAQKTSVVASSAKFRFLEYHFFLKIYFLGCATLQTWTWVPYVTWTIIKILKNGPWCTNTLFCRWHTWLCKIFGYPDQEQVLHSREKRRGVVENPDKGIKAVKIWTLYTDHLDTWSI